MHILFISKDRVFSPDHSGAGALASASLRALMTLGHHVELLHVTSNGFRSERAAFESDAAARWIDERLQAKHEVRPTAPPRTPVTALRAAAATFGLGRPAEGAASVALRSLVERTKPDVLWADHYPAARLALSSAGPPVVYSHYDWLYRVHAVGGARGRGTLAATMQRRREESVARRADAVVSGSETECAELRSLGCAKVHRIPVWYEDPAPDVDARSTPPRVVHLGGTKATATRLGLEALALEVWPRVRGATATELLLVGDLTHLSPEATRALESATRRGFVPDLSSVLLPADIHVISYQHDTGQRTRLPLAFAFAQAVVATPASVAGFPEAVDGENCVLAESPTEMAAAIDELLDDDQRRRGLALAARATYEASFTLDAVLPRYEEVLRELTAR
jgi:glycosyltransferase involved in cell wall biosynthesis